MKKLGKEVARNADLFEDGTFNATRFYEDSGTCGTVSFGLFKGDLWIEEDQTLPSRGRTKLSVTLSNGEAEKLLGALKLFVERNGGS